MKNRCTAHGVTAILAFLSVLSSLNSAAESSQNPKTGRPRERITFNRDIAPIIFRSCAPCHHSGEAGPFPLITYGEVKSHARQIADLTSKRLMPPWLPSEEGVPLQEDAHLSPEQIAAFQQWVADGILEGNPAELPVAPQFSSDWQLGKPDLILRAEVAFAIPASGSDVYWNFIFREPVSTPRFVQPWNRCSMKGGGLK